MQGLWVEALAVVEKTSQFCAWGLSFSRLCLKSQQGLNRTSKGEMHTNAHSNDLSKAAQMGSYAPI